MHTDLVKGEKNRNQVLHSFRVQNYNYVSCELISTNTNHYRNRNDIYTLTDALNMIIQLGDLVGKQEEATNFKLKIEVAFS